MKSVIGPLMGGIVVIAIAAVVGVAHNVVRSHPVKLVQSVEAVSTAQKHADDEGAAGYADTGGELPEDAVSLERMKEIFDEGVAMIIDARAPGEYEKGHIPGSLNVPYDRLPDYLETLEFVPKEELVVCYCRSLTCDFSDHLATELKLMGYEKVVVFTGGWDAWTEADYPAESGAE